MRIDIINLSGICVASLPVTFIGYGREEFQREINMLNNNNNGFIDPILLFDKVDGKLSKNSSGKFAYYVFIKKYNVKLNTYGY